MTKSAALPRSCNGSCSINSTRMPRLRRPPPSQIMDHLALRFREGRISVADFDELHDWLESDPEVPSGQWFKRFRKFTLAGEGELPKTFLAHGMAPRGEEVQ